MAAISIAPNLIVAILLGTCIGLERQWRQNYAGLITHALVAVGAAAYTSLPGLLGSTDPSRLGGQVVTGIGFLGAGLIMRDGLNIRGLSAAATVWATGSVGALAGYGLKIEALEVTVLIILANACLPTLSSLVNRYLPEQEYAERVYVITLMCASRNEAVIRAQLLEAMSVQGLRLRSLESRSRDASGVEVQATVYSTRKEDEQVEKLVGELSLSPNISLASWTTESGDV